MTVVEKTVTTVTVTEMGMKSTQRLYCKQKGLYTLLSRCIDPWNNREVWVDNYFSDDQLIFFLFGREETITLDHQFVNITSLLPAIHMVVYGRAVFW